MNAVKNPTIARVKGYYGTPVLKLAVAAWLELLENGLVEDITNPIEWNDELFVAVVDEKPIGFIAFAQQEWNKVLVVRFGYVVPGARRFGVYEKLWAALRREARKRKVARISSATFLTNAPVRACAKKRGSVELMVTLENVFPFKWRTK